MPVYSFICKQCQGTHELICSMTEYEDVGGVTCDCGSQMQRDYVTDRVHSSSDSYRKPIISDSLAIHPDQIAEHRKAFPDVRLTSEGQPILENYKQHENYMNRRGVYKKENKHAKRKANATVTKLSGVK